MKTELGVVMEDPRDYRVFGPAGVRQRRQQNLFLDPKLALARRVPEVNEGIPGGDRILAPHPAQAARGDQRRVVMAREALEGGMALHVAFAA